MSHLCVTELQRTVWHINWHWVSIEPLCTNGRPSWNFIFGSTCVESTSMFYFYSWCTRGYTLQSLEFCCNVHYNSKYMRGETWIFGLDTYIHAPPATTLLLLRRVFWLFIMLLSMRSVSIPSSVLDRDGKELPSLPSAGGVNCLERLLEKTCDLPCAVSTRDMISTCWSWTPDRGY